MNPGRGHAGVSLSDAADARIRAQQVERSVGRAVVHRDHLEGLVVLCEHAVERLRQETAALKVGTITLTSGRATRQRSRADGEAAADSARMRMS